MTPTTGVKGIGGRPSVHTIEDLRKLTDTVIGMLLPGSYRKAASAAMAQDQPLVYVPADADFNEEGIDLLLIGLARMRSNGNDGGEPVYPSLLEANAGRNLDGSRHTGYLVIDVVERLMVDSVDRNGGTRIVRPLVLFNAD